MIYLLRPESQVTISQLAVGEYMLVHVAEIKTRYEKIGHGSPVIILHGWGGTLESVKPIVQCLSRNHTVFIPDLPGFGQSQQPVTNWGVFEYAVWVNHFMDTIQCDKAHFIGHSFGGRIAIILAAQYSHRVNRLILVDSAGIKPQETVIKQIRIKAFKAFRKCIHLIPVRHWQKICQRELNAVFGSADYRDAGSMRAIFVRVVKEDLRPLLTDIQATTLLIWGENDEDVPVADGKIMAQEIPNAHLRILPGAGHFSYLDRLPKFCRLAQDFLEEKSL